MKRKILKLIRLLLEDERSQEHKEKETGLALASSRR